MRPTSDAPLPRAPSHVAAVRDLEPDLSRRDTDPEHAAYVTYHVGVGSWGQARTIGDEARSSGWRGTFYVNASRWVVRLVVSAEPTVRFLDEAAQYVERLAREHGGQVLGVTVEDPLRDDVWGELVARVVDPFEEHEDASSPVPVSIPAQRDAEQVRATSGA